MVLFILLFFIQQFSCFGSRKQPEIRLCFINNCKTFMQNIANCQLKTTPVTLNLVNRLSKQNTAPLVFLNLTTTGNVGSVFAQNLKSLDSV